MAAQGRPVGGPAASVEPRHRPWASWGPVACRVRAGCRPVRAGQNTRATSGKSNIERNTDTPSTMLVRILVSRVFQSWLYQRLTASTRSRRSVVPASSVRSMAYLDVVCCEARDHGLAVVRAEPVDPTRVHRKGVGVQHVGIGDEFRVRDRDPCRAAAVNEAPRFLDFFVKERLVDGAVVHVSQRHPSHAAVGTWQHAVQLDNPADEVRIGLLPEGLFALTKELIQEGRDRVRQGVRIEPGGTQRVPRDAAIETQLDVVVAPAQFGQHGADVVTKIALHFKDERGGAPVGIAGLPVQELGGQTGADRRRSCRTRPRQKSPRR